MQNKHFFFEIRGSQKGGGGLPFGKNSQIILYFFCPSYLTHSQGKSLEMLAPLKMSAFVHEHVLQAARIPVQHYGGSSIFCLPGRTFNRPPSVPILIRTSEIGTEISVCIPHSSPSPQKAIEPPLHPEKHLNHHTSKKYLSLHTPPEAFTGRGNKPHKAHKKIKLSKNTLSDLVGKVMSHYHSDQSGVSNYKLWQSTWVLVAPKPKQKKQKKLH